MRNLIKEIIDWKRFAEKWGAEFKFTSKQVAFFLPEKSAPFIRDEFENELFQEGGPLFERSEDKLSYSISIID